MKPDISSSLKNILLRAEIVGKKNWLQAINILEKAADDYPRERSVYLSLGDIYMRQRKFEQAIESYQKALTMNPKDEHLLFIIGNCYLSLTDYKMALYYYEQVSDETPELHYNKALAYAYSGNHELSVFHIKSLLVLVPDNMNVYFFLIEEFLRLYKYNDALEWIDIFEQRFGIQRYQQILKGFAWHFKKIWLKSFSAFKIADELSPITNADHLHTYAQACIHIGQFTNAVDLLEKAISLNPFIGIIHEDLIRLYIQLNDYDSASASLKRASKYIDADQPIMILFKEKIATLKNNSLSQDNEL